MTLSVAHHRPRLTSFALALLIAGAVTCASPAAAIGNTPPSDDPLVIPVSDVVVLNWLRDPASGTSLSGAMVRWHTSSCGSAVADGDFHSASVTKRGRDLVLKLRLYNVVDPKPDYDPYDPTRMTCAVGVSPVYHFVSLPPMRGDERLIDGWCSPERRCRILDGYRPDAVSALIPTILRSAIPGLDEASCSNCYPSVTMRGYVSYWVDRWWPA